MASEEDAYYGLGNNGNFDNVYRSARLPEKPVVGRLTAQRQQQGFIQVTQQQQQQQQQEQQYSSAPSPVRTQSMDVPRYGPWTDLLSMDI